MDDNQQYNTSVLSFSSIFRFIKRALPITLACMLLITIIGTCSVIALATGNKIYSTQSTIELTYTGADKGLNPDGTFFSRDNIISIDKVESALKKLGLTDISATDVKEALAINAQYSSDIMNVLNSTTDPDELLKLLNGVLIPTKYSIELKYPNINGLSKEDSINILNAIIETSIKEVADQIKSNLSLKDRYFNSEQLGMLTNYEFVINTRTYLRDLSTALSEADDNVKLQLNSQISEVNRVLNEINIFSSTMINSGLMSAIDKQRALDILNKEKISLDNKIAVLTQNISDTQKAIENCKITVVLPGSGGSISDVGIPNYTEIMNTLTKQLVKYTDERSRLNVNLKDLEADITLINAITPKELTDSEKALLNSYKTIINNGIDKITESVNDKAELIASSYGIKLILAPVAVESTAGGLSNKTIVLDVVMFVIAGFVIGLLAYAIAENVINKRRESLAAEAGNAESTATEREETHEAQSETIDAPIDETDKK